MEVRFKLVLKDPSQYQEIAQSITQRISIFCGSKKIGLSAFSTSQDDGRDNPVILALDNILDQYNKTMDAYNASPTATAEGAQELEKAIAERLTDGTLDLGDIK